MIVIFLYRARIDVELGTHSLFFFLSKYSVRLRVKIPDYYTISKYCDERHVNYTLIYFCIIYEKGLEKHVIKRNKEK